MASINITISPPDLKMVDAIVEKLKAKRLVKSRSAGIVVGFEIFKDLLENDKNAVSKSLKRLGFGTNL